MTPRGRGLAVVLTALPILLLTLVPGAYAPREELSLLCVVCGWRGTSDAILNVVLFVPFGLALGALGGTARRALAVGFAFSLAIELLQFVVPNRNPGLGDLIYNALGSALGATLYFKRAGLIARDEPRRARGFTRIWGLAGILILVAQVWLLGPAIPKRQHLWEWTPETDYGTRYEATVVETAIDGAPLPAGVLRATHPFFTTVRSAAEISVEFEAGEWPFGIAPLVRLRAGDDDNLYIGLDYRDIIVRYRTRGMALRLDRPYPRWARGARTWAPGDRIRFTMSGIGRGIELAHSGGTIEPGVSGYDPGPVRITIPTARGWGFLSYPRWAARTAPEPLDFTWMLLLALPLGLWGAAGTAARYAAAWIAALYLLPLAFPLVGPSFAGALGVAAAVPLGLIVRFVHGNPEPFKWWKPFHTLYDSALAGSPMPDGAHAGEEEEEEER